MKRRQLTIPARATEVLRIIPQDFRDDGLSTCPDSLWGFNLKWAGRIHDWRYCTRGHAPGRMTQAWRRAADYEIKDNIQSALPWRWRWVGWVVRFLVWKYGGIAAFDSCGYDVGEKCRHNMGRPTWMQSFGDASSES
jgi:hypothetical protein